MAGTRRLSGVQKAIRKGGKDQNRTVLYPINEGPQTAFMMTDAEEVLYGGAAGGGKSYGLRAYAVSYCMTFPGAKGVLFRQSFRQLEETHLIEIQKEVPETVAHYAAGPHDLVFDNGSLLMFRFCEKDEDARSYDTAEFDFELFDELSHFTKFQYCLGLETPILTDNLRWVPAGSLKVGDNILSFDEHAIGKGAVRKYRKATITHQDIIKAPTHRITLEDGRVIDATPEHAWLVRRTRGNGVTWQTTKQLFDSQRIRDLALYEVAPFATFDDSYASGMLAGAFDADGMLGYTQSLKVAFAQKENALLETVRTLTESYGSREYSHGTEDVRTLQIGRTHEVLRFLMNTRPPRLMQRWQDCLAEKPPWVVGRDVKITSIEAPKLRPIARISSSAQTYIAAGFASHNTYLTSRCRSTRPGWTGPRIRSGATPLGRGHAWVKARWVDAAAPMEIWKSDLSEGGMTRQFIPARVTDNPVLVKSDPKYLDRLHALPYEEYRAKALGDWDVFTGQFLVRWRQKIHVIEPFDIDPEWDLFLCVDYGFNNPYAALWFARPPGTDTAFVYREQYGPQITLKEQARRAWEVMQDTGEKLKAVILDPSMFGKVNVKGERITPMSDTWTEKFSNHCPVVRGNNERVPGWRLIREMIDWKETPTKAVAVPPRLFVFNTCSNTARTLPLMIVDKHNPEDVDTDGEDHAPDALRYGLRHAFEGAGRQGNRPRVKIGRGGITVRRG